MVPHATPLDSSLASRSGVRTCGDGERIPVSALHFVLRTPHYHCCYNASRFRTQLPRNARSRIARACDTLTRECPAAHPVGGYFHRARAPTRTLRFCRVRRIGSGSLRAGVDERWTLYRYEPASGVRRRRFAQGRATSCAKVAGDKDNLPGRFAIHFTRVSALAVDGDIDASFSAHLSPHPRLRNLTASAPPYTVRHKQQALSPAFQRKTSSRSTAAATQDSVECRRQQEAIVQEILLVALRAGAAGIERPCLRFINNPLLVDAIAHSK
ncbi:hypothetical protein C8R45DRAFT_1094747 [Mycena sanguinolenta]|nr:hypothetical protein C8R45DRAFT_1094747 [Mycena sanguinolenta]